jgi:hypothetical protein
MIGKVHHRLPGRVASADNENMHVLAKWRFARAAAVVQASAKKLRLVRKAEPSPLDAGRAYVRAGYEL